MSLPNEMNEPSDALVRAEFAKYAGSSSLRWRSLIGQKVRHIVYGTGEIVDVSPHPQVKEQCLIIQYTGQKRYYRIGTFSRNVKFSDFFLAPTTKLMMRKACEQHELSVHQESVEQQRPLNRSEAQHQAMHAPTVQMQQRAHAIQQFCQERQIKILIHFTRIENVPSILQYGVVPRSDLEQRKMPFFFNDTQRGRTIANRGLSLAP